MEYAADEVRVLVVVDHSAGGEAHPACSLLRPAASGWLFGVQNQSLVVVCGPTGGGHATNAQIFKPFVGGNVRQVLPLDTSLPPQLRYLGVDPLAIEVGGPTDS